jgi:hypothetical protein
MEAVTVGNAMIGFWFWLWGSMIDVGWLMSSLGQPSVLPKMK